MVGEGVRVSGGEGVSVGGMMVGEATGVSVSAGDVGVGVNVPVGVGAAVGVWVEVERGV